MERRSYKQFCGIALALDRVGGRWTLLIVRELLLGPRRYGDLLSSLLGITTNLLAQRLKDLRESGLIEYHRLKCSPRARAYRLTAEGRNLKPVLLALGEFGSRLRMRPATDDRVDIRWAMVSLMRRYVPRNACWTVGIQVDECSFSGRMGEESLEMCDGTPWPVDVSVSGERSAWVALFFAGRSARELVGTGALQREGRARAFSDFVRSVGGNI